MNSALNNMRHDADRPSFVLLCDEDSVILDIVRDTIGITGKNSIGIRFAELVDPSSRTKAAQFFSMIRSANAVCDGEIAFSQRDRILTLSVAGAVIDKYILILGGADPKVITNMFGEIMTMHNDQANAMRAIIKQYSQKLHAEEVRNTESANSFSQLNNELMSLQRDITKKNIEYQKINNELIESKQILEDIAHAIPDSILLLSKDHKILWANTAARKLIPHDIVGEYCYTASHHVDFPCKPPHNPCPIPSLLENGENKTEEHTRLDKAGNTVYFEVSAYPIKNEQGEITRFVHISHDITERIKAEEAALRVRENAARIERLEEELRSLAGLSPPSQTSVTARMYGIVTLQNDYPETFAQVVAGYEELMDLALEQKAFKVKHDISGRLSTMAETIGFYKAGPRDVVDIHTVALRDKNNNAKNSEKRKAYTGEGWIMVLELMGHLASFYRNRTQGSSIIAKQLMENQGVEIDSSERIKREAENE